MLSAAATEDPLDESPRQVVPAAAGDGLDNKERWHWRERDLRDFVTHWLLAAMVAHEDGALFDDGKGVTCRTTTVRGDFDNDGAALLHWRKGKCFATFSFNIRMEYLASYSVGGRSLGQARGVVWLHDINSEGDVEADDASRQLRVEGAWEKANPNQPAQPDGRPPPQREPAEYEQHIKAAVERCAAEPIRIRIQQLRRTLTQIAASDGKDLPTPEAAAAAILRADAEATGEPAVSAAAQTSAAEYVEDLRRKHRSDRHKAALGDTGMAHINLGYCDLRGPDLGELVELAFKANQTATILDLSQNPQLDDAALQPLLIALASGALPALRELKLQGTGAAQVTRNMAKGLTMMRKTLDVQLDE